MRAAAWADAEGGPPPLQRARWSTGAVRPMTCSNEGGTQPASVAVAAPEPPCAAALPAAEAAANGTQTRDCNGWREAARPGTAVEQKSVRRPEHAAPGTGASMRIDLYTEERQRLPRRRRPPPLRSKTVRRCLGGAFAAAADAARVPASTEPGPFPAWMQRAPDPQDAAAGSDRGWFPFASGLLAHAPARQESSGVVGVPGKHAPACSDAPGRSPAADRPPLKHGVDCWSGGGGNGGGRIKAWRASEDSAGIAISLDPEIALEAVLVDEARWASGSAPGPHTGIGQERTLGEVLRALGGAPLPEAAARAVAANAAVALAELHGDGLVHRALGPDALVLGDGACFDTARCPATRCAGSLP